MRDPFSQSAGGRTPTFESFEYFRDVLQTCPYITIVLDQNRQIVFFNRALQSISGPVAEGALFGRTFGEAVQCDHALGGEGCGVSDECHTCGAFLAVTEGLKGHASTKETRLIRKVGDKTESLDVQVSVSPILAGGERFVACYVRDITHEKRRADLERIFFHDISSNATGVELLSSALAGMVKGDASVFARQIRACATQMVEEIESQQQLLSAEKDELAVRLVSLTTGAVIHNAVQASRGCELAKNRSVRIDADSHDVPFETDPSILRRVLRNMLLNALEASHPGESIAVGCRDHGDDVEFWVHNPGVMPEPVRQQIFQRAFSTRGAGRGLGTYSIKLLSERYLKGAVTFRSTESEGTRFSARYPKRLQLRSQAAR